MRYNQEIEDKIIAQINAEPDRELILPDWAYWEGKNRPMIYVNRMPVSLVAILYQKIIGPLDPGAGLKLPPQHNPRNVNPHLFVVTATKGARLACRNGHPYDEDSYTPGVGYRCKTCARVNTGKPTVADINRAKTHCPQGHVLVTRANGKRRCKECPRAATAAWREKNKEQK